MEVSMSCSGVGAMQVADIHTEMVRRYAEARRVYCEPRISDACALVGLSEREYCERYVAQMGAIYMTCSTTNPVVVRDAFIDAVLLLAQEGQWVDEVRGT
jgi:hypothetical protein